jgi:carboxypeptidase Taq
MKLINENLNYLKTRLTSLMNYNHSESILHWDLETGAPKESIRRASKVLGFYSEIKYNILTENKFIETVDFLEKNLNQLEEIDRKIVVETKKDIERIKKIPVDEYREYQELIAKAQVVWGEARSENNFKKFQPYLEKIVEYSRKYAEYKGYKEHPYDALIDDYEPNMTVKKLNVFFQTLRKDLVPFIEKIKLNKDKVSDKLLKLKYNTEKQKEFSKFIAEYLGFDFNRGILKESLHPFSMGLNKYDVRMTTRYHEEFLQTSIFGTIHETGHSIYEQSIGENIWDTALGGGNSMGIHESQSRLYENLVARTKEFWEPIYEKLVDTFPENLTNISLDEFYLAINKAEPSMIRVEADELTYSLHIMLRYEIEKELIEGSIEVKDLPRIWTERTKEYLGLDVKNDAEGVLQDVHWSAGLFGYFPSYALGSANASQIMNKMGKTVDIKATLKNGELFKIKDYLNENIHQYGKLKDPSELMMISTGEEPNSKYYTNYLIEKYSEIYDI